MFWQDGKAADSGIPVIEGPGKTEVGFFPHLSCIGGEYFFKARGFRQYLVLHRLCPDCMAMRTLANLE